MKRLLLAGVAVTALSAIQPALGADLRMPVKAPPAAVVALYNWSGCYVGVHGGYAWGKKRVYDPSGIEVTEFAHDVDGPLVGGQVGCNLQRDRFVIGIEGQAAWADVKGEIPFDPNSTAPIPTGFRTKIDILGSIAARFAYAFGTTGQTLAFVKIGGAFAHEQFFLTAASAFGNSQTDKFLRLGGMVGVGFEHALGSNFSAKAEYNYNFFGKDDYDFCNASGCERWGVKQHIHLVKIGINYRFGASPVVARY